MEYFSVSEARNLPGLRLVLTQGVPGPWGEAAKKILEYKNIAYIPVAQLGLQANDELENWTGSRNAPTAVYEDEKPKGGWFEILCLAERLSPSHSLIPRDSADRAMMFGISNEICGMWGFGWCRRLMILDWVARSKGPGAPPPDATALRVNREYEVNPETVAAAPERVADILLMLTKQLKSQRANGSRYFIGSGLTACDIYWACFSLMTGPLPKEVNPMPDYLWPIYSEIGEVVQAAKDPILEEHRNFVFETHFTYPLDF